MRAGQKINVAELKILIDQGLSTAQIADRFQVKSPAVTRICRSNNLPLPHGRVARSGKDKTWTREDDERDLRVLRLVRKGWAQTAVAQRLRISVTTVKNILTAIEGADLKESGEPVKAVAPHYGRKKRGGFR